MVKKTESIKPTSTRQKLIQAIEAHVARNPGTTEKLVGWYAVRDSSMVQRLRDGKSITIDTLDAVLKYLANPTH